MNGWYYIINPGAAGGRAARSWRTLRRELDARGITFGHAVTQRPGHAGELAAAAVAEGYRDFAAVGGDGTLNEILEGICRQDIVPAVDLRLTQFPLGTGNDWRRTHRLPTCTGDMIDLMGTDRRAFQDVGVMTVPDSPDSGERYFMNIAGLGFDAVVAAAVNRAKRRGRSNRFSYLTSLLGSLITFSPIRMTVIIDGTIRTYRVLSMCVAICRYNGNKMQAAPRAVPDDGLFDIIIISAMPKWQVIRHVKKLYDGSFLDLPQVHSFRGSRVRITAQPASPAELDGESAGATPVDFHILPRHIGILVPPE